MSGEYSVEENGIFYNLMDELYFSILLREDVHVEVNEDKKKFDKFDNIVTTLTAKVREILQETFDEVIGEGKGSSRLKFMHHIDGNPNNNDHENLVWFDDEKDSPFYYGLHYNEDPVNLKERFNTPELRLATLEMWQSLWTPRIQEIERNIEGIVGALEKELILWEEHLNPMRYVSSPDDFDTQEQVEERRPDKDDCLNCWQDDCDDCPYEDLNTGPIYPPYPYVKEMMEDEKREAEDELKEEEILPLFFSTLKNYQEEYPELFAEPVDKLEPQVTTVTLWNDDKTAHVTIKFPDVKAALKFTQGIPF